MHLAVGLWRKPVKEEDPGEAISRITPPSKNGKAGPRIIA
jgi:hypothetical protein